MLKAIHFFLAFTLISINASNQTQHPNIDSLKNEANDIYRQGIALTYEGRYKAALDTFKNFLSLRKKIYGDQNYLLGKAYSAIGISYKNLQQNNKALENFQLAELNYLSREKPSLSAVSRLYINLGNVYRSKLDYNNAKKYYSKALSLFDATEKSHLTNIAEISYSIAEIDYIIQDYSNVLLQKRSNYKYAGERIKIYFCYLAAGAYQKQNDYTNARNEFLSAIETSKSYFGHNHMELAFAYMNYAQMLAEIEDYNESFKTMSKAYDIIQQHQTTLGKDLSQYYNYLGSIEKSKTIASKNWDDFKKQKKKNLQLATTYFSKALSALDVRNFEANINQIETQNCLSLIKCLELLQLSGDAYFEMAMLEKEEKTDFYAEKLEQALDYFATTTELIQQARREISSDESKIQLAEIAHATFLKTIDAAFLMYDLTDEQKYMELAFANSEQIKSSAIFDKISNELAADNSLVPDSLLEEERMLNSTISIYSEKLFEENSSEQPDSALIREYNEKVFSASKKRDELNRFLEENYADYYNLKYSKSMLKLKEAGKKLSKKDVILDYVLSSSDSTDILYSFLITKHKQVLQRTSLTANQTAAFDRFYEFASTPNYIYTTNEDSRDFYRASHQIYQLLVKPFEADIANKNVTVVADGKLNYIPFEGLIKTPPDSTLQVDFSQLDYLLRHNNIGYANSVNLLFSKSKKLRLDNSILAFAPKYNGEQFELNNSSYTLMPLPGIEKELEAIGKCVKTTALKGKDATEENFRKKCGNYDILHLAMHAYINDSLPAFSRLAFHPEKATENLTTDGWLNTADIYNLNLNARLTVLSACNTGVGKLQKGEGLMSLARGFLYAGCPSIVMSLWEVEDHAGTQIMTYFYKYLKQGKTKDKALRLAKLKYLENSNSRFAHPHYWMSFKCIGDKASLYTSYDIYFFSFLFLLVLAFSTDQFIRIRKARRKRQAL